MHQHKSLWIVRQIFHRLLVVIGAAVLTLIFFLVLPLMQTIGKPPATDLIVHSVDTAKLEAPTPPPQEEKKEETQPDDKPPELTEDVPPLNLSQLELALNPTPALSEGWMGGDFAVKLNTVVSNSKGVDADALFSIADLDEKPRVIYQPGPILNKEVRQKAPGTVYVLFVVDQGGRVENPIVQKSTDTVFEKPALNAVKQWKFEPGKRNGQAVRFRMRVPVSFPKG
jgi:protein TonB